MSRRSTLVDRLRGVYTVPVNNAVGLLNNEAADEIERLRKQNLELVGRLREAMHDGSASAHVIIRAGVIPGISYECRCDECRSVAKGMDSVGYLNEVQDRWWVDSPADSIGDVKGDKT